MSAEMPKPGLYTGVDMGHYHSWPAASNSRLSRLLKSPAHLRAYIEEPPKETPALRLGRAIHTAVLEPDEFSARYKKAGQCMGVTKKGARCSNNASGIAPGDVQVCGVHMPKDAPVSPIELLSPDDWATCSGIRDTAYRKVTSAGLLVGDGRVEVSVVWEDEATGVTCKGRWDREARDVATIVDLKTTVDASPREFERSIFRYNYHVQGALYLDSAAAHDVPAHHYCIVAAEKEPPYAVAVYRLMEGAIEAGRDQVRPLLERYAELQTIPPEDWQDYPDEVRDVSIPDWAWRVVDDRIQEIEEQAA